MKHTARSIRPFIGAKHFQESRQFYKDLGFEETALFSNMSLSKVCKKLAFYLQDAYVKDWIDHSMIFLEVENVAKYWNNLQNVGLDKKYKKCKAAFC